ncbi:MAG: DUF421 domain-containing protein [Firmicutes bacterium]|nr:DUF421 domain-containing protein [Bacillota bacterium]
MIIILIRTIVLYFVVLFTVRIMGKSELSKSSPFQMVILFMIAELASMPIDNPDVPLLTGFTAIAALLLLQVLISFLSIKSEYFKNFVNGKPSILISSGKINERELISQRISINDLMEQLRIAGAPSITDVDFAVMESNGSLSVILRPEKRPVTPEDLSIPKTICAMPLVVVSDGTIYKENLRAMGYNEDSLLETLHSLGINSVREVFMVFADENQSLHIYKKTSEGIIEEVFS